MMLDDLARTLSHDAMSVVFLNVLLQQLGLPMPAVPTLLLVGGLAAGPWPLAQALGAAVLASVLADAAWYALGRVFGYRVLAGLCRLSINPSSCVSQTEARFIRWGLPSLVVAKFIPGFSTVAPPIAGALRMDIAGFGLASALGAALWAGVAIGAGWCLRDSVPQVLALLAGHGAMALLLVAGLAGIWLGWKFWQKYRFRRASALPHISPDELLGLLGEDGPLRLLDLRSPALIAETGPLSGAVVAEHDRLLEAVADWPRDRPVVTLCACPEDAGAVQAAHRLVQAGYRSVRPLRGGYAAWADALRRQEASAGSASGLPSPRPV